MSQIRVKDYTGKVIHKKKRGFATKKEALEWERDFLNKATADMGMLFQDFVELYFEDMSHRLKESTIISKHYMVDKKILPVFGKIPINEITPKDIRKWQNSLTAYRDENGKPYSQTYLKAINNQLTAMFNYAVKYYDLHENPCTKAGRGVRTFSWTAYAVNPRDRLYSTGLRYPNDFLILFSLYQRRYRSNSCENSSMVTSCQS